MGAVGNLHMHSTTLGIGIERSISYLRSICEVFVILGQFFFNYTTDSYLKRIRDY